MGATLDRLFKPDQDPPEIGELIDALVNGEPTDGYTQSEDPLSIDKAFPNAARTPQSDNPPVDPEGFITGRAAEFATSKDLQDWRLNHSKATGDNGVGAWGDVTAGNTPGVAVPRNWLAAKYGSEDAARGKMVQIIAPNGKTATVPILDKGPRGANRANDAVIEVNPAAKRMIGVGDSNGWRYRLLD